jgi:hypothetical protein
MDAGSVADDAQARFRSGYAFEFEGESVCRWSLGDYLHLGGSGARERQAMVERDLNGGQWQVEGYAGGLAVRNSGL